MKKVLLTILIIGVLVLTGCGEEQIVETGGAFIGGTTGIEASFEPFSIEEDGVLTIFDTEDFPIDITVKNKGEQDIDPGQVTLKLLGPAPTDFANIAGEAWTLQNQEVVQKISEFNPDGGEEVVSFTPASRAAYQGAVTGFVDVTWNLEYSYQYKTHLIVNDACFKGDITDPKVCEVRGAKTFSVSGAPITVTSVEQDTAGKGVILLKIIVSNAGVGDSTIIGQEFDKRFEQLSYSIDEPEKWECKSGGRENEARLIEGTATIICKLKSPLGENDLYVRNVRLTMNYLYKDLIREKLRIKESIR